MFDFENDSEADAKTATSLAPAAIAASKPYTSNRSKFCIYIFLFMAIRDVRTFILGVRTGNLTPLK